MKQRVCCLLPLLLLCAGCFSSTDSQDAKPFTPGRWREMIRADVDRMKPEEQRRARIGNPVRVMFSAIGDAWSQIYNFATGKTAFNAAKALLDTSAPDNRRSAIVYLSNRVYGRQDPYLKQYDQMARSDSDGSVRAMAIRGLNRGRDKRAVPLFLAALEEKNDRIRLEAAKALANIPDPSATAPLIRHMENPEENLDVRIACADALRNFRTSEVAQALVRALRDRSFGVSWQARKSLQLMTGQDYRYDTVAWLNFLSGATKTFGG
jgi:HEAT repeat protein